MLASSNAGSAVNFSAGTKDVFVTAPASQLPLLAVANNFSGTLTAPLVDNKGQVYNVKAYGAVGDGATDDSTAIQAAINDCLNAVGGTIYFPPATYRVNSQLTFPNNSASIPTQNPCRLMGCGCYYSSYPTTPTGGTILDLRYAVGRTFSDAATNTDTSLTSATAAFTSGDVGKVVVGAGIPANTTISSITNSTTVVLSAATTATATGVTAYIISPKIITKGLGLLEISGITFLDGGASGATPFLRSTNTCLHVHDCAFYGRTAGTSCTQDAIILGGTSVTPAGGDDAPFQGYGTVIQNSYFGKIRRAVYGQVFCNGVVIRDNTSWSNCGGSACYELVGSSTSGVNSGNVFAGNLVEATNYTYVFRADYAAENTYHANNLYDATGTLSAFYRFELNGNYNIVQCGYHDDTKVGLSDVSGNNTYLVSHQSQRSTFAQPVEFLPTASPPRIRAVSGATVLGWQVVNGLGDIWDSSATYNTSGFADWVFRLTTASRTVTDGVLNSTTTLTSATANFVSTDVGRLVTATGVTAGTTIASVTNSTTVVLSAAATATASGVSVTIGGGVENLLTLERATTTQVRLNIAAATEARFQNTTGPLKLFSSVGSTVFVGDTSNTVTVTNGLLTAAKGLSLGKQALTYGATVTNNAALGSYMTLAVTDGNAFTIAAPSTAANGMEIVFEIYNNSGGAMGVVTWNATFHLDGSFANPANGKRRVIRFVYNGTAWYQSSPATADMT